MHAVVVNASEVENIAVKRFELWLKSNGWSVTIHNAPSVPGDLELIAADRLYISVIFSWNLPAVAELAHRAQSIGVPVEIGGPAADYNAAWILAHTGIQPHHGPHHCINVLLPRPSMTWTSRGCVRRCDFCQVWRVEGGLVELDEWQPAPVILDNNFLACSPSHQERALRKLAAAEMRRVDFNQGLDARLYTPAFRELLARCGVKLTYWRFAYDRDDEWMAVERALLDLRQAGIDWAKVRVYLLYNHHETPGEAEERAEKLINNRSRPLACPWPMAYRPLDWMQAGDYVAPQWTLQQVRDFRRYYSRPQIWRSAPRSEYDRAKERGSRTEKTQAEAHQLCFR